MPKREQTHAEERRGRAEARLASQEAGRPHAPHVPDECSRLVHELQVHQIELEMQNDELRIARNEIEVVLQRYTELFDFAPIGYVVLDRSSTILETNLEFARMVGIPRGVLPGWLLTAFIHPDHRMAVGDFLHRQLQSGTGQPSDEGLEVVLQAKKEAALTVRLVASLGSGEKPNLLVAVNDVSASKRAEAARAENARKDEFIAALSHELRNPLFPISTSLSVLERAEPGGEQARKATATIDRQVRHLVRIVDDLLDLTRIARGKVHLHRERLELAGLVRHAVEDHQHEFGDAKVALESHIDGEPLWVDADGTRLVQVVGNLLLNAAKFTPAGGRVDVRLRRERDVAILSVRDNGAGIAPDVRDRLFLPFAQGSQTLDRSRGGLGLGLALVKGLVELHGGAADASSEGPGCGSEFTVRLPLVKAPSAEVKAAVAPRPRAAPRRVLVIEDNVDAAEMMSELIAFEGHETRVAFDGLTGLALAREFRPDVVFCDIGLPQMDGYEVARQMRADPALANACLVALSGYARPEDRERSAEAGFDCHLAKPPATDALEEVLDGRAACGHRHG